MLVREIGLVRAELRFRLSWLRVRRDRDMGLWRGLLSCWSGRRGLGLGRECLVVPLSKMCRKKDHGIEMGDAEGCKILKAVYVEGSRGIGEMV